MLGRHDVRDVPKLFRRRGYGKSQIDRPPASMFGQIVRFDRERILIQRKSARYWHHEPTPVSVVDSAVSVAAALGAHLAALSCETHVQIPGHFLAGSLVNIPGIIAGETVKSRRNAQDLLAAFDTAAEKAGISNERILEKCATIDFPDLLVEYARLRDLTIVPVPESYDQW